MRTTFRLNIAGVQKSFSRSNFERIFFVRAAGSLEAFRSKKEPFTMYLLNVRTRVTNTSSPSSPCSSYYCCSHCWRYWCLRGMKMSGIPRRPFSVSSYHSRDKLRTQELSELKCVLRAIRAKLPSSIFISKTKYLWFAPIELIHFYQERSEIDFSTKVRASNASLEKLCLLIKTT